MQTYAREPVIFQENEVEGNNFFFEKVMTKLVVLWPWIIVSVVCCLTLSYIYLRLTAPEYRIKASILVQDEKKGNGMGEAQMLEDLGLTMGKSNVDNEAEILKSRTLMEQVVMNLQLNIHYYIPGKVKTRELFTDTPVKFRYLKADGSQYSLSKQYILNFDKTDISSFQLSFDGKSIKGKLGDTLYLEEGPVVVTASAGFPTWKQDQSLLILVAPLDAMAQYYSNSLSVSIPNKEVSVIYLTLNESFPKKGEDILNGLLNVYLRANVNDKKRIADSTMEFIDERLKLVLTELTGIEKDIEGFKTSNKITDIDQQSHLLLENTSEYSRQQTAQEVQLSVVNSLESFLKDNVNNTRVVPSSLVMQDPNFVTIIQRYNEIQLQKDRMLMSLTAEHPSVISVESQLKNIRSELLSSIGSIKRGLEVGISELKKRTDGFEGQISKVPAKQRVFLDISRQQAIKQELYLFLLKKREETAISKSSTLANARIIDPAKGDSSPFKPKKTLMAMTGLLIGLLIPFMISFGRDFLNNKISSQEDISDLTRVPVLAEIGHNKDGDIIAVTMGSRNIISEQFRSLRTNLQYLLPEEKDKIVLVTSSMSGEGKSFMSINLCMALALAGKKVLLMELDLRKPKISDNLHLIKRGFSNYTISNETDWTRWVQPSGVHENFEVFASGPLPPNPAELLMLPKVKALFKEVKDTYDYIVVDSPPAGMVTDAEIMGSYVDTTLYIVRHEYTFKHQISLIESIFTKKKLPKINIVVNDLKISKGSYRYGYGYGYGDESSPGKKTAKKKPIR